MDAATIVLRILLQGKLTNADFVETIEHVPELTEAACEILIERQPTNEELISIITHSKKDNWHDAWEMLLTQSPSNHQLLKIIEKVDELRSEAWEQLLKQTPSNEELVSIILMVEPLRITAWQILLAQSPSVDELWTIYQDERKNRRESLRIPAAGALLNLNCGADILCSIMQSEQSLESWATRLLLNLSPSPNQLRAILYYGDPAGAEEAAELLLRSSSDPEDLRAIVRTSKSYRAEAAELLLVSQNFDSSFAEQQGMEAIMKYYGPLRDQAWDRYRATNPSTCTLWNFLGPEVNPHPAHPPFGMPMQFLEQVGREIVNHPNAHQSHWGRDSDAQTIYKFLPQLKRTFPSAWKGPKAELPKRRPGRPRRVETVSPATAKPKRQRKAKPTVAETSEPSLATTPNEPTDSDKAPK